MWILQAKVYCTPSLAKKAVIGLLLFSLSAKAFRHAVEYLADVHFVVDVYIVLFNVVVPLAVLTINVIVERQVRRASNSAADLGRQQSHSHHQGSPSSSSNSAVP